MKTRASIVLLALVLIQSGCKSDPTTTVIASLGAVSSASSVAIAVVSSLESGGQISEEAAREIITYAQAVSTACADSVAALNAGGTTKEKVLNILSAIVAVETPVIASYGDDKAKAAIVALNAALAALKVQLQAVAKDAKSSPSTPVCPTTQQTSEIQRIGREAQAAAQMAAAWSASHPVLLAGNR